MKKLFLLTFILIYTFTDTNACDPDYRAFCQTISSLEYKFEGINTFAGTIASKSENSIEFNILSVIRGEENRNTITIWDGPVISHPASDPADCDYYATGYTSQYGNIGDTIFCTIQSIEEKINEWEVIGDYRRPATDGSYNSSFVRVENGLVSSFDTFSFIEIPYSEFLENTCTIVYTCTDIDACNYNPYSLSHNTVDDGSCFYECIKPVVDCPPMITYYCTPTEIPRPALTLEDFNPIVNGMPTDDVYFSVREKASELHQYTVKSHFYTITDREFNRSICAQHFYMPNEVLEPPVINSPINVCENQQGVLIDKPAADNYFFYADNNGEAGELIASCEHTDVQCFIDDLGIDTSIAGSHQFWVTKVIVERIVFQEEPGFLCESEPVLLTVNINGNQTEALTETHKTMPMGSLVNLMDMVDGNKTGNWQGKNVFSFKTSTGKNLSYFYPTQPGLHKLYYTVGEGLCQKTHIMIAEVLSGKKGSHADKAENFLIYPNPSTGKVSISLFNMVDVPHAITVYDTFGKQLLVHQTQSTNNLFELDLSKLSKGVYIIKVSNPFIFRSEKLLLK